MKFQVKFTKNSDLTIYKLRKCVIARANLATSRSVYDVFPKEGSKY